MRINVIAPQSGGRHEPLVQQISRLECHSVRIAEAQVFSELPSSFDTLAAYAVNNRQLLPGEVGCASAHLRVWQEIAAGDEPWACVLEDDARVVHLEAFSSVLGLIERRAASGRGEVISFYSEGAAIRRHANREFAECLFEPPFAVAYCVSREAAAKLAIANQNLWFPADWPRGTDVSFLLTPGGLIAHGDAFTRSLIRIETPETVAPERVPRAARVSNIMRRLRPYVFANYYGHRKCFTSPSNYYRLVLRHRILWLFARSLGRRIIGFHPKTREVSFLTQRSSACT